MAVRSFFTGDVVEEIALWERSFGPWRRQVTGLLSRVDGVPELFIETRVRIFGWTGGVSYFHLPKDGYDDIQAVVQGIVQTLVVPLTAQDVWARRVLRLGQLPFRLLFVGVFLLWLAMISVFVSLPLGPSGEQFDRLGTLFFTVGFPFGVLGLVTHWATVWGVSKRFDEPMAATIARIRFGPAEQIRPMGTWQGAMGKDGLVKTEIKRRRAPSACPYTSCSPGGHPVICCSRERTRAGSLRGSRWSSFPPIGP